MSVSSIVIAIILFGVFESLILILLHKKGRMMSRIYSMIRKKDFDIGLGFWFQSHGNGDIRVLNIHILIWCLEMSWLINTKE
jgi:hypothetical protein